MRSSSLWVVLGAIGLISPATAAAKEDEKAPREACDKLSGRDQLKCIEENYPNVHEKVAAECKSKESGDGRWDCRVKAFADHRIKLIKPADAAQPEATGAKPGATTPAPKTSSTSTGVLTWSWYNMPAWTGTAPSIATAKASAVTSELSLTRNIDAGAPASGVSADWFIAKAKGEIFLEAAGSYNFELTSREGATTLTIAGQVLAKDSSDYQKTGSLYFANAGWVPFELLYAHEDNDAEWAVEWQPLGASALGPIASTSVRPSAK